MSLVTVMKGPVLMAGSTFISINMIGAVDPMMAAIPTARMIPTPTVKPMMGEDARTGFERIAIIPPQSMQKNNPFKIPPHNSLRTIVFRLSDWKSPFANHLTITVAP